MEKSEYALELLDRIIEKGGLIGSCAKMYANNVTLADNFIRECKEQCHNKMTEEYWGEDLVADIINYPSIAPTVTKSNLKTHLSVC